MDGHKEKNMNFVRLKTRLIKNIIISLFIKCIIIICVSKHGNDVLEIWMFFEQLLMNNLDSFHKGEMLPILAKWWQDRNVRNSVCQIHRRKILCFLYKEEIWSVTGRGKQMIIQNHILCVYSWKRFLVENGFAIFGI